VNLCDKYFKWNHNVPLFGLRRNNMIMADQSRTLALFSDRENERAAINEFLQRLQQGSGHERPSVLSFYGVGGVGKSALREKALTDFQTQIRQNIYSLTPPGIAEIDLDSDSVTLNISIAQFLGRVRAALNKKQIRTPLFDYLYLVWWGDENPGQSIKLKRQGVHEGIGAGLLDVAELASSFALFFGIVLPGDVGSAVGAAQGIRKLYPPLSDWFEQTRVRPRFDGIPEGWSQAERVERMPVLLAHDLLGAVEHQPQTTICLVIDGFERVQSREPQPDAQRALVALVSEVLNCAEIIPLPDGKPMRGRIGFMVFGREKLRWAELYSRERVYTNWQQEIDDHAQLLGLSENDARSFLVDLAAPWERGHGRTTAANLIESHVAQILQAASEQLGEDNSSYLPYYLDLAVLLIRDNAVRFKPEMLGNSRSDLDLRFLRYLKGQHREALQALALALEFDRKTFEVLIERGLISGYSKTNFDWLVGDHWSFVTPIGDRPGFHNFHRHMQQSLVASLSTIEDRARAKEIILVLLERLYVLAHFDLPADLDPEQTAAYLDAMDMLRIHESTGLLDGASAIEWGLKFESLFDSAHAMILRRPHLYWGVETSMRELGAEHPDTLMSMNNLAMTLQAQGDFGGAHALQEQVLNIRQRVLGTEHLDTLTSMSNLAMTLQAQGDFGGARALQEKTLDIRQRVLGAEHPHTLTSMNNLAATLQAQGDLGGAHALQEKVLDIRRRVLGAEHPNTLLSMNNLAMTLHAQGDLSGARALQEQVLAIQQRVLGAEHPNTLTSMNNLALTLQAQGDLDGARALQEQVLTMLRRVLGAEHPGTLTSMNNLAMTLQAQGDFGGAPSLQEQVLNIRQRVLGAEHPDTLMSMSNLAMTLQAQGDFGGAHALQEQVLNIRQRVLGAEHPHTLVSMSNLALTLYVHGDFGGARALQEKTLDIQQRVLGAEHPNTLSFMSSLALTLQAQGDLSGARALQEQVLAIQQRVLGAEHPNTLLSMNNLALTLQAQDDFGGARALQEQVLDVTQRVLGAEHPHTLTSMSNLAATLQAQDDLGRARALQEKVLDIQQRVQGAEHPDTLTSMNNLAMTLQAQGDFGGARTLQEKTLDIQQRVLGAEHPNTLMLMSNLAATLQAQDDLGGARALREQVLDIRRQGQRGTPPSA
jgi:tetratricopeptide (TPR) repeat protein